VCKVGEWEELRVKGMFQRQTEEEGNGTQQVRSRYFYQIQINKP